MLFSSLEYVFIFLPLIFLLYFGIFRRQSYQVKTGLLLIASLFFYSWWLPKYLPILLLSILFNFFWGRLQRNNPADKRILTIGIVLNLCPLFFSNILTLQWAIYPTYFSSAGAAGIFIRCNWHFRLESVFLLFSR